MKKWMLLLSLFVSSQCLAMKKFDNSPYRAMEKDAKPQWNKMVSILKHAPIKFEENDLYYSYEISFKTMIPVLFVAVKSQALSYAIFGQEVTDKYTEKFIIRGVKLVQVEVPFNLAQGIIEKKWGHL